VASINMLSVGSLSYSFDNSGPANAVKPTSSILSPRRTVDRKGAETEITTTGRHAPCVGIRAVPVGEAMMACVLADLFFAAPRAGGVGRESFWDGFSRLDLASRR
jgi:hypothetical protein